MDTGKWSDSCSTRAQGRRPAAGHREAIRGLQSIGTGKSAEGDLVRAAGFEDSCGALHRGRAAPDDVSQGRQCDEGQCEKLQRVP